MDVNRAQSVTALANNGGGQQSPHKDRDHDDKQAQDDGTQEAYEIGGLAADVTPAVQQLLDDLAAELEPLRAQLALAREREHELREDLARHAFLPVPGRREFLREVNHVINHLADLTAAPSVAIVHIANADHVRRAFGRDMLDRFLTGVAHELRRLSLPTDVIGNLGGNDFAMILLGGDPDAADQRFQGVLKTLSACTVQLDTMTQTVAATGGCARLKAGGTAEAMLRDADMAMPRRTGDPSATR